jgi:O-antigen/teichoic acid export membrane protein
LNPLKQLAGQTAIYGLPTILGRLLNYLLVPLYTYQFATSEYGVVTEMYAYVSLFAVILTYGMETAFFRYSQTEDDKGKVYGTSVLSLIITSAVFITISMIFAHPVASRMGYAEHTEYIRWFVLVLAFDALSAIPFARLRELNKAGQFALIKSINIVINLGLNLFFILLCPYLLKSSGNGFIIKLIHFVYNPEVGVGYIFISNLIASGVTLLLLLPVILDIKLTFNKPLWKRMIKYALPIMIFGMAGIVNETFDRILLKHLLPGSDMKYNMSQLGIYGACYKISILMTLFIQTFKYAAEPFFFNQSKNTNAKLLYAQVMKYFVMVCCFIFLAVMMYIDVVMLFVGREYRVGQPVVPILLLANLFLGVFYNLSIWYKLTGQTIWGAYISIFGAVLTLILNFWLVPIIGYMGAAWATFICYGSMMVASYIVGQKYYPINYNVKKLLGFFGLSILFYFVSVLMHFENRIIHLTINTLILFLYVFILFIIEKPKKLFAGKS